MKLIHLKKNEINTRDKYDGYYFKSIELIEPNSTNIGGGDPNSSSSTSLDELPELIQDESRIKVNYEKRTDLSYTVFYIEKDTNVEIKASDRVENQTFDTQINAEDIVKTIDGFTYNSADPASITISTDEAQNRITLKYTRNTYPYEIKYYYNNNEDSSARVTGTKKFGERISYEPKEKVGYKFDRASADEITITSGTNLIEVFYEVDPEQTKELSYVVEYYKDNVKVNEDTITVRKTVQVLEPETLTVDKSQINTSDKYVGYVFDSTEPETIPDTIANGSTIKVKYRVNQGLSYTVNYVERSTNKSIHNPLVKDGQTFGNIINASNEIIDI